MSPAAMSTVEMSAVEIRTPGPADAERLARCQLDCWGEAYAVLADPVRLAALLADVDARVRRWHEILAGPARVRLAEDDGEAVGFATVVPGDPAYLAALYVRRSHWSTGLGQRLLDEALGDEAARLEVFRDNVRARRFYARNGFVPDGTQAEEPYFGGTEIGMFRLARLTPRWSH
jgi:ribosomal protein S18 acetylase RimI-like enzyme